MDDRLYWMWLQHILSPGENTRDFLSRYPSASAFYQAGESEWKQYFSKRKSFYKRATEKKPEDFAETLEFCDRHKLKVLTADNPLYPQKLLEIENFPLVLYVRGDVTCLNAKTSFGVIGSRIPSVYGEKAAKDITARLSESSAVIVSGGALGIDSVAHRSALETGGKTVLVMGCGHGYNYLRENAELRKAVTKQGAVISEYPPFTPVTPATFPLRNRIISGMSRGIVIIEAAERSGTFSTANHAKNQGRELYVLPGDINSGNFAGSNQLITEGAVPVFSGDDVLRSCGLAFSERVSLPDKTGNVFPEINVRSSQGKKRRIAGEKKTAVPVDEEKTEEKVEIISKNIPEGISKNAGIVYNIMSDGAKELDDITRESALEIRHVLVALTELEMLGIVTNDGPNRYSII